MNMLLANESGWLIQNKNAFLYGTEAPDNSGASLEGHSGYGDTASHHNYYSGTTCTDDAASRRAGEEYQKALNTIKSNGSLALAAWYVGAVVHYISDMAVWAHVMSHEAHHSEYENQVNSVTDSYSKNTFTVSFDGTLETISAYDAAKSLGSNTYDDNGSTYTALWMNSSFQASWTSVSQWSSLYKIRAGESINLGTNIVAAVLHTLTVEAGAGGAASGGIPIDLLIEVAIIGVIVIVAVYSLFVRGKR